MGFKVLLISQHLFSEILLEAVLGVHAGNVKIKSICIHMVVTMHLLHKGFMENYQCWYAHGEVFVSKKRMEERVVGLTSSASNVHEQQMTTLILIGIWLWMQ